jgi:heptosyltransferase-2
VRNRAASVLVHEVGWLGDLAMSLPALRAVRRGFPSSHFAVLLRHELASLLDGVLWIDEVIPYRHAPGLRGLGERLAVGARLRARGFDLAIVLPGSFESALRVTLAGIPHRIGFATDARQLLLSTPVPWTRELEATHQSERYLTLLQVGLGLACDGAGPKLEIGAPHRGRMQAWLAAHRRRPHASLVAVAPTAAYGPAKEWPLAHHAALIGLLADAGAEPVLVGSAADRPACASIAAASGADPLVAAGETSVGELAALLAQCDGVVGNDSGVVHVAAAVGAPVVAIFGSTSPARTAPRGAPLRLLQRPIECSPCFARTCRTGDMACVRDITPGEVAAALEDLGVPGSWRTRARGT